MAAARGAERIAAAQRSHPHGGAFSSSGASSRATSPWRRWISRRSASSEATPPRSDRAVSSCSPPRRQRSRSMGRSFPAIGAKARCSAASRSEEHTSELQSQFHLVCRLLLEKKKKKQKQLKNTKIKKKKKKTKKQKTKK